MAPAGTTMQSVLESAAAQARAIELSWWIFFWACLAVYVLVMIAVGGAFIARRRDGSELDGAYRRARGWVIGGAGATAIILVAFLVVSVITERELNAEVTDALHVAITGQRWWWGIEYLGEESFESVRTANELHLPAGVPVKIDLQSRDVIHSFWVPNLHGKMDLIPGTTNTMLIHGTRPGVYRGQCAEFCGIQHAHMGMLVIVHPAEEFEAWLDAQRRPAMEPRTALESAGREAFTRRQCVVCHTVRGTGAFGNTGPDLTHFGSRRTIGAATLPNTRGHLAGWVADPHSIKPGVLMPPSELPADELQAITAWLESLK